MSLLYRLRKIITSQINDWHNNSSSNGSTENFSYQDEEFNPPNKPSTQIEEDLSLFDLTLPSSLAEVKKKRNQILKQYHPDRFHNQEKKLNLAKELIQEYNDAFKRLEEHFKNA